MKPGALLFWTAYCLGVGVYLERKGVPAAVYSRAREVIDGEIRRNARIMTDEIHARHKELEAVKL